MTTILPQAPNSKPFDDAARVVAVELIAHAARCRQEADRALRYFLRTGLAHGMTVAEVAAAGDLTPDEVLELTHPAAV